MADPVTIIATIYGVAGAGLKLSVGLYSILDKYDTALDAIENIASDLNFFAIVLEELGDFLNVSADQSVASDRLIESIEQIMAKCQMLFKEINRMIFRANGDKKSKIGQRIEWFFKEGKVRNVKAVLDSLKATLGVMLQTLKLKTARGGGIERERKVMKNLIRTQQHSLRRLRQIEKSDDTKLTAHPQINGTETPAKQSPMTSVVLSQIMPPEPIAMPPIPMVDQSATETPFPMTPYPIHQNPTETSGPVPPYPIYDGPTETSVPMPAYPIYQNSTEAPMPQESSAAIGVFSPSYDEESDYVQLLLKQWTRPSTLQPLADGKAPAYDNEERYDRNTMKGYGQPVTSTTTFPGNNAIPEIGLRLLQRIDFIESDYRRCLDKRINDVKLKMQRGDANLELRLASLEKAREDQRSQINAAHEAGLSKLEVQLLARECKEDTVRSINLELERSQSELEAWVQQKQSSETMEPAKAHINRLQVRLEKEGAELTTLKESLVEARMKIKTDFESKVAALENNDELERDRVTIERKEEISTWTKELSELDGLLKTSSTDFTGVRDEWISLMKKIGAVFMGEPKTTVDSKVEQNNSSAALDWLDEGLENVEDDDSVEEPDEYAQYYSTQPEKEIVPDQEGSFSDKIPMDENIFEIPSEKEAVIPPEDSKAKSAQTKEQFVGVPQIVCRRQAWKPPQPFHSAFNTFAYIINLNFDLFWFKASRDEYRFFRSARPEPFYTIELVPADLRTFQTSKIEWTVLHKAWANSKALITSGYAWREDSDGHIWIKKDLTWAEVKQLFHMSCTFLDKMMTASSRKVLAKRSEENGENLPNSAAKSGVLARLRKAKEFDQHFEFYGTFFRPDQG